MAMPATPPASMTGSGTPYKALLPVTTPPTTSPLSTPSNLVGDRYSQPASN